ncbi:preprotein translocase subunit SecA [Neisseria meningitidis]|uniref:preprotein translocase subunit SecA n=1 Tax=Neisseria meningitidis TaxID=487 RepID=UPI00027CB7FA|nr:preprotein translocase subunit SecA [Neisseria meningitidis]EJU66796.1 preprotein translocase, SecA subunit [Neisseria meningitidis 98008]MBG8584983.1 preprotein translocase subunit SecA [Neisseria meningitidis]MBG8587252.1 preprotein translocase subunit SecA [Neisseria meningitidis]MBG8592387.1 preprotein translocase subunit SecA [Neisseria meningitidis]MBG8600542.1 preprotein translocase subunit SecA [Neisseria meningitidis]
MLTNIAKKIFGSRNDRLLKQYRKSVARINALEEQMQALSDADLQAKTAEFKQRLADGQTLDGILPEAFAVCREASRRTLGMRHFDVQLIGGMVLHDGKIAEMRTGEGKTLVATLAVYLNALAGKGVHVVTVNDYLASRDAGIMEPLYNFLGLTVGVIISDMQPFDRQNAYAADITYGTNNEFGFDYLRDNMVTDQYDKVQRELNFAVVDEVDSILIDEARTPLIISGQADDNIQLYQIMNTVPPHLVRQETEEGEGDYWVDEKAHQVILSEAGHEHAEQILTQMGLLAENDSLYSAANIALMHHLMAALRAHSLFHKDQHYVIQDGEIVIVDEFTGRLMSGRRWSEGLHQAVEAKEGVEIKRENQTLASITFQNYFRLYTKLSGMTGTADTEAFEFQSIYNLETVIIPTNRPVQRKDFNDQIFRSAEEKFEAVVKDIEECHKRGQPVLVGTTSIENSELVSHLLQKAGLPHNVLNAKEHEREALIVAQAGKVGAITVATNMAGRGTDIVLGGNLKHQTDAIRADEALSDEEKQAQISALEDGWQAEHDKVMEAGGLHIIGTERHESRRIDNQLRGRSGRQGDPGSSRFYLSFEDPLLRLFALDRAAAILNRLAPERGVAIEHNLLTRQIEGAQRKVEGRNFDMRKQVLEYDDVANEQRKVIYSQRNEILTSKDISDLMKEIRFDVIGGLVDIYMPPDSMEEQWDIPTLENRLAAEFRLHEDIQSWLKADNTIDGQDIKERLIERIENEYAAKTALVGKQAMADFERNVMLQVIDNQWREHLAAMDYLRQGIHLRSYAQKNPKQEYKREAFTMFQDLWNGIKFHIASLLTSVQIEQNPVAVVEEQPIGNIQSIHSESPDMEELLGQSQTDLVTEAFNPDGTDFSPEALEARGQIVHRNDPCPCGSGLKYKQCHGKLA